MAEIPENDIQWLYASLMAEVKARLQSANGQFAAMRQYQDDQVQLSFVLEFCYLQLRRVTELCALAVLAAHNPHPEFRTKDLLKQWNAKILMEELGKLHAEAFPQLAHFRDGEDGKMVYVVTQSEASPEARDLICDIYKTCCDKLHTGALRAILKRRNKVYSAGFVRDSIQRLSRILDNHFTKLPDGRLMEARLNLLEPGPVHCRWLGQNPPPPSE